MVRKDKVRTNKKPPAVKLTEKEVIEAAAEENISFIQTWDEIFQKSVTVAEALKEEILKNLLDFKQILSLNEIENVFITYLDEFIIDIADFVLEDNFNICIQKDGIYVCCVQRR